MDFNTIEFSIEGAVARLVLNRPDRLNSFNAEMHEEIRQAMMLLREDGSVRCLLLTGNGRGFCAGQDLSDRAAGSATEKPNLAESLEKNYNPFIRTLTQLEMPVICAVNGVAAGAGANIALACDIVLAAKSASFIQAFCKIGLVPDASGSWMLPRLVGQARAMGLALLGDKVSAEQAEQWGMIWKCIDDDQLMAEAEALAAHFVTQPTQGLAYTKRAIHASSTNTLDQQLDLERDLQQLAGETEDFREGVQAFVDKRKPNFKGK